MSTTKFQRFYTLAIQGVQSLWTVTYPFTLRMEISRSVLSSANTARLTIYNLPPTMRKDIFMDRTSSLAYRKCILQAGYAGIQTTPQGKSPAVYPGPPQNGVPLYNANLYKTFQGNIMSCSSERRGADWVTTVEAFDGGLAMYSPESKVSLSLNAPWTGRQALETLVSKMKNVSLGVITPGVNIPGSTSRGYSAQGDAWTLTQDLIATSWVQQNNQKVSAYAYIDNEKVNVAMEQDVIYPDTVILRGAIPPGPGTGSQFTWPNLGPGLIGVPKRLAGIVEVPMIFQPNIKIGQQAQLSVFSYTRTGGSTPSEWNGTYQVRGLRHEGTISGAVDGGCTTLIQLWNPAMALALGGNVA